MRDIREIIIHCAYTKPSMNIGAEEIRQWHLSRGWADIGYAYVVKRNGWIEKGRDLNKDGDVDDDVGAHALGHNRFSIGICLVGGMNEAGNPDSNFTSRQYAALKTLISILSERYPLAKVIGHRDISEKACPCFDAQAFISL